MKTYIDRKFISRNLTGNTRIAKDGDYYYPEVERVEETAIYLIKEYYNIFSENTTKKGYITTEYDKQWDCYREDKGEDVRFKTLKEVVEFLKNPASKHSIEIYNDEGKRIK